MHHPLPELWYEKGMIAAYRWTSIKNAGSYAGDMHG